METFNPCGRVFKIFPTVISYKTVNFVGFQYFNFIFQLIESGLVRDMLPAVTISFLNLLLPFAFRIIASIESYDSPKTTIEISLFRFVLIAGNSKT